ncbi:MAG: TolC family protein [Candidatus Omnitrophota bacterium]|jgi:outer membrane protein TolC
MSPTIKKIRYALLIALIFLAVADLSAQEVTRTYSNSNTDKLEKTLIQSGKFYFAAKKYDAAIQQWSTALTLDPKNRSLEKAINDAKARLAAKIADDEDTAVTAPLAKGFSAMLTMKDCIDIAVKNHIPLQVAQKSIKLADQRLWEARRNMLPTVGIRFEEYSGRVQAREYTGRKQYLEGQQPVYHGGELYYTMKQAEVNLEVVKTDYARIRNELVLQVKKGYYTLLKSRENLKLQQELSGEVAKIYDMVNRQAEVNIIPKLEVLNVSSQVGQVKFQLASADGDEAVAELILKQAMNVDYKENLNIQPKGKFKKIDVEYERVLKAALMNRPEMKINELMIAYYNYEKYIARAKGRLKLDLMGNWGLAKEEFASQDRLGPTAGGGYDQDQKMEQQWYAGVKGSIPFWGSTAEYSWTKEQWTPVVSAYQGTEATTQTYKFNFLDNLKVYSDKISAEIDFDRSRQELVKIRQDITLEAREGCFAYEKAILQLDTATNKVMYQEKDLEVNKLKRGLDELPDSTIIESSIKLAQEKFGYVQAVTDCFLAVASLNKAIGVDEYFEGDGEDKGAE